MRFGVMVGVILACAASMASAQTTKPAPAMPENPYENMAMPARRGATTQAASAATSGGIKGSGDVFDTKRLCLALGIVLLAIYVSHRVWKKLGMPGASGRGAGVLQVVSRLSIAPKQQIMLVRVGRRLVLVGNSGAQMNALCEIGDADEAAAILGDAATQREESSSAAFSAVLGGEQKQFEEETEQTPAEEGAGAEAGEEAELATTRAELSGLMDKVRSLSNQFRRAQD